MTNKKTEPCPALWIRLWPNNCYDVTLPDGQAPGDPLFLELRTVVQEGIRRAGAGTLCGGIEGLLEVDHEGPGGDRSVSAGYVAATMAMRGYPVLFVFLPDPDEPEEDSGG